MVKRETKHNFPSAGKALHRTGLSNSVHNLCVSLSRSYLQDKEHDITKLQTELHQILKPPLFFCDIRGSASVFTGNSECFYTLAFFSQAADSSNKFTRLFKAVYRSWKLDFRACSLFGLKVLPKILFFFMKLGKQLSCSKFWYEHPTRFLGLSPLHCQFVIYIIMFAPAKLSNQT